MVRPTAGILTNHTITCIKASPQVELIYDKEHLFGVENRSKKWKD
jgi:hypothetical protein